MRSLIISGMASAGCVSLSWTTTTSLRCLRSSPLFAKRRRRDHHALFRKIGRLAVELAGRGITCNAIAPGVIETDMTKAIRPEVYEIIMKTIPMGRAGKPEEIASAAVFLLSEGAAYITRQVIEIDGGM